MMRTKSFDLRQAPFGCRVLFAPAALALAVVLSAEPAFAQSSGATMWCELSSDTAFPGTSVTLDLFLEDAVDVRGYQATIAITRTSGTGEVTVPCPGGVTVDESRSDYIFPGLDTENLQPDCSDCGMVVTDCESQRVAVARVTGGVEVGGAPAHLATYTLDISPDAAPGSTFGISILPFPASIVGASDKAPIDCDCGSGCSLEVIPRPNVPMLPDWSQIALAVLLLAGGAIVFRRRGFKTAAKDGPPVAVLVLLLALANAASAGELCESNADCDDANVCSFDRCIDGSCSNTPATHADVASIDGCGPDGAVDLVDVSAIEDGFRNIFSDGCSLNNLDVSSATSCEPDGAIDLFDLFNVLSAFAGTPNCHCRSNVEPPECDEPGAPTDPECCDEDDPAAGLTDPVYLFSGEFHVSFTDLRIPGRGLDFVWARKYRSKIGPDTAMGNGWDFSYNFRTEASGQNLILHNGNTRSDTYLLQPDGTWTRKEFFRVIERNPDASYTLTFPDTGTWNFNPLDGSAKQGKVASIVDRNGNTLTFDYDAAGRLVTIHDALDTPAHNRDITIVYNADGFIESVTDFAGRSVTYEYYDGIEPGGSFGDLKSATTPAVVNTPDFLIPPGHEYPDGKTTVYTYSTGFADDRLNDNLLSITDPKGQTYLVNEYYPTTDPNDLNFDRVKRQTWGDSGDLVDLVYIEQVPTPANGLAITKVVLNDRVGNVKEFSYDSGNRAVIVREYTGRADPDLPTTETNNRPTGQLRPSDPPFFETRHEYNADSLRTRTIHPNGDEQVPTYDTGNASRRSQGNMQQQCRPAGPLGGDQAQICESYEYDDGFGGCCGTNFVTRYVDGRGNETLHTYDAKGNRTHTTHSIPSIVEDWEYNEFGQMTTHFLPDNGSAHRRRDEYTYYDSGPQLGYLHQEIVDVTNFALRTRYEYNPVGQVSRVTDPRGHDTQYIVNQLDQTVRSISREVSNGSGVRYERDTFYDPNDNVVRIDIQNIDDQGVLQANTHFTTLYEYDILNYRTRTCEEAGDYTGAIPGTQRFPTCAGLPLSEFITTEYEYDANRNRTLMRYPEAVEGRQPTNVTETRYDERDLTFQVIRAPGDPDQSTTQYDYDRNRNRKKVSQGVEDTPRVTTYTYDGYDRLVSTTDAMGNVATYHYDANHNRVSINVEGELIDVPGSAGNVRLSETTYVYDAMDRLTRTEVDFFDADTQTPIDDGKSTTQMFYSANSQVTRVVNDNAHQGLTDYDTANRRSVVTDHKGNTVAYTYDANSNVTAMTEVEESDLGNPNETFMTTYAHDNLDRLIQTVDNVGNTHAYVYDSRNNRTRTVDALSNVTRYTYDGINRLTRTIRDLDDDGADGDGPDITTTQAWDDTSRLIAQADDKDNTTRYAYDALNRLIVTQMADGTFHQTGSGAVWVKGQAQPDITGFTSGYDVHDNRITITDANGSVATNMYDLLDRLISKTIAPGAGVSSDTTFEIYRYDGLSRLVHGEDDDSVVTRSYDSLSRLTRETLNGQTTTDTYDGVGNQLTCTYPGGRVVTNTYDELERKKTISDGGGTIATYNYVGPGRVERREYGNGTRTDYTYDGITGIPNPPGDFGLKRIIRTKHSKIAAGTILDDRTYTWDPMYNKTRRKDVRIGGPRLTHDYTYDDIYRLVHTTVTDAGAVVVRDTNYDLDGVGNRTTVTGAPDPGPHVGAYTLDATQPDPADEQTNQYTTTSADARVYDFNGNLIRIDDALPTRRDVAYDYRNQMVEYTVVATGERHTYAYDALGRRIAKIVNANPSRGLQPARPRVTDTTGAPDRAQRRDPLSLFAIRHSQFAAQPPTETRYFYHGWQVIEEQDAAGTTQATYVYGLYIDEVLNMQRDTEGDARPEDYYYHTDDLYNVMAITDASGNVVERYEYADYGQPLHPTTLAPIPGDPSAIGNPYLFTGRRYDPETGWYYYRTRYLDPVAGRFTTRDTIGIWGDPINVGNAHTYVNSNPGTGLDPTGKLNARELAWCAMNPICCAAAQRATARVTRERNRRYPAIPGRSGPYGSRRTDNDVENAVYHCAWMCSVASSWCCSVVEALALGRAHESAVVPAAAVPRHSRAMDLYNNSIGAGLSARGKSTTDCFRDCETEANAFNLYWFRDVPRRGAVPSLPGTGRFPGFTIGPGGAFVGGRVGSESSAAPAGP